MPLNAAGWTTEEDEKLADLVRPNTLLYHWLDPSRKNILARESTWSLIGQELGKPVEECKKRWRGLRDGYMRSKRMGSLHKTKVAVFEKLQFLDGTPMDMKDDVGKPDEDEEIQDSMIIGEQQVITDNQEYYEITLVESKDDPQPSQKQYIKILPKLKQDQTKKDELPKRIKKGGGRKKSIPIQRTNIAPIKILPKPFIVNGPKVIQYVEDPKTPEQRSQTIDKLIERMLKENTNEIDVFFRSMAASVKKLQPNLIPKVKMEVCNVIAKYEMQSFDKM